MILEACGLRAHPSHTNTPQQEGAGLPRDERERPTFPSMSNPPGMKVVAVAGVLGPLPRPVLLERGGEPTAPRQERRAIASHPPEPNRTGRGWKRQSVFRPRHPQAGEGKQHTAQHTTTNRSGWVGHLPDTLRYTLRTGMTGGVSDHGLSCSNTEHNTPGMDQFGVCLMFAFATSVCPFVSALRSRSFCLRQGDSKSPRTADASDHIALRCFVTAKVVSHSPFYHELS